MASSTEAKFFASASPKHMKTLKKGILVVSYMSKLPDLPPQFVEHIKHMGRKTLTLAELVDEYKRWKRRQNNG